jgi:geranylgeranyl diphosphate synthase type I
MTEIHSPFPTIPQLRKAIEEDLRIAWNLLEKYKAEDIAQILSYHLGWLEESQQNKGKRIRPLLTLLSCAAVGGDWLWATPVSSCIELIHNFSLIHDDIEDGSETRRGQITIWKRWGVPKAINIGDAVFVLGRLSAHRITENGLPDAVVVKVFKILDHACMKLTVGQDLDLAFETREDVAEDEYLEMIEGKTSALLAASTSCGGVVAQADTDTIETLHVFGHHLGMAFQIRDDILGLWGDPNQTGKSTGDDLRARKKTLPIIYGLRQSEEFKERWDSGGLDDASIESMREALESSDALAYTEAQSEKHTELALQAIASLGLENNASQLLTELTSELLIRQM